MLFAILLIGLVTAQPLAVTFECESADDLYALLYGICNAEALCRGLYQLDGPPANSVYELAKFQYQVSLLEFFLVTPGAEDWDSPAAWRHPGAGETLRFLAHIWPPQWQPIFTVLFNATTACATSFNTTLGANLATIYALLDLMKTYRQFIAVESFCGDSNERLLFDPVTHRFYCLCAEGKICSGSEGNHTRMIDLLLVLVLGFVLLLLVAVLIFGVRIFRLTPGLK